MNYKREYCTATDRSGPGCFNLDQQRLYAEWNDYAKDHQYSRQTVIGSAIYLNTIAGSVAQVRKALAPSTAGNSGVGWVGYAYRTPDCRTNNSCPPFRSGDLSRAELTRALTQPSEYDPITPAVFAEPAAVPRMSWKDAPTLGHARGTVRSDSGAPLDQVRVDIYDAETEAFITTKVTDGSGWFGVVDLIPRKYKAVVDKSVVYGHNLTHFTVRAGKLSTMFIEVRLVAERPNARRGPDLAGFEIEEVDEQPTGER